MCIIIIITVIFFVYDFKIFKDYIYFFFVSAIEVNQTLPLPEICFGATARKFDQKINAIFFYLIFFTGNLLEPEGRKAGKQGFMYFILKVRSGRL